MGRRITSVPRSRPSGKEAAREGPTSGPPAEIRSSIPPSLSARVIENGIVAAAMRVFARRGFTATRVEDVLEEAGVARRTFYRYFTSKEDVLAAVYELATAELVRAIDDTVDLHAAIDLYLDFHIGVWGGAPRVENAALLRVLVEQSVRSDSPLAAQRRRFRTHLLRVLVRAADARGVSPLDGFTYVALVSALEGVALELLEGRATPEEVERAKQAVYRLVEGSLRAD